MNSRGLYLLAAMVAALFFPLLLLADGANFDLEGPALLVHVTRGHQTLAIGEVPNLQSGDRIWIQPAFPEGQAVHYLMIVSFLRGATNPPPEEWFVKAETWNRGIREEGLTVTVPQGAEQAMVMLAPVTGGDFTTLRAAVLGKPGTFVRAVQDLQQASLQRSRLDKYLAGVQKISANDPGELRKEAPLLAKSLKIKLDAECFERPVDQQSECLTQNLNSLVLADGTSQSMVAELTSGANSDLIGQVSATRMAGGGLYSPYVGAIVDMVKIFSNLHTARYQYIPAISVLDGEHMGSKLNNPPSFQNPKSVIVMGLPPIRAFRAPVLIATEGEKPHCLEDPSFVLPLEGAPLLFSTGYGRNLKLQVREGAGKSVELPVTGDAARGGLVLAGKGDLPPELGGKARLRGYWGFDGFEGPHFQLLSPSAPSSWRIKPDEEGKVLAGQSNTVHLLSQEAGCSEKITLEGETAKPLTWKADKAGELELQLPLENVKPGDVELKIKEFGIPEPQTFTLRAYSNDVKVQEFDYYPGDNTLEVTGAHLDQLAALKFQGVRFQPASEVAPAAEEITLAAQGDATVLKPVSAPIAKAELRDGRTMEVNGEAKSPRPRVTLLDKQVAPLTGDSQVSLRLGDANDLPVSSTLTFFVKTEEKFSRAMKIEVATVDQSASVQLGFNDGGLVLQDANTARAELNPAKNFGPSVFGPLRFRIVDGKKGKGAWQPLARLVRLPKIARIVCPPEPDKLCRLEGSDLFLISALSSDDKFTTPVAVTAGFAGVSLDVPRPNGALLYLKLRDAPDSVNRLLAPVFPAP